jgi:hypothetical protein
LEKVKAELDEIADTVNWQTNYGMWINFYWVGVTRLARTDPRDPWKDLEEYEVRSAAAKAKAEGLDRRPLIVGIMREYLDAMKHFPKDHEAHLRAKFLCAYTMIHEVGHAVWAQDFRSENYSSAGHEPFVGDDAKSELGSAFMSRMFSGYDPNLRSQSSIPEFDKNLVWTYRPKQTEQKPLYTKEWAIPIPYMEELFSQTFWDALRQYKGKEFSIKAREKLKPSLTSLATKASKEWTIDDYGRPRMLFRRDPDRRTELEKLTLTKQDIAREREFERLNPDPPSYQDTYEGAEDYFGQEQDLHAEEYVAKLMSLPPREIWDGVLPSTSTSNNISYVTVEVRHRSGNPSSTSTRSNQNISYDQEDPIEVAAATADHNERFGNEVYDCRNIDELLENKKADVVAKMTMRGAYDYCQKHGIIFPLESKSSSTWGVQILNKYDPLQRGLIERIRLFAFQRAEERFKGDNPALLKIKEERRRAIEGWTDEDIRDWLMANGIPNISYRENLIQRVKRRMDEDIERIKEALPKSNSPPPQEWRPPRRIPNYQRGDARDKWSEQDFEAFFRSYNVPSFGTRATQCLRVERWDQESGLVFTDRSSEIHQDAKGLVLRIENGVEVYRFGVDIQGTTVEILKEKLYLIGFFPAKAILHLRFGTDGREELQDDQLLSVYASKDSPDWKDVWLDITFPEEPPADPDEGEEDVPQVYQARGSRATLRDDDEDDEEIGGYDSDCPHPTQDYFDDEDDEPIFRPKTRSLPTPVGNSVHVGPAGPASGGGTKGPSGVSGASRVTVSSTGLGGARGASSSSVKHKADDYDYDDELHKDLKRKRAILRIRKPDGTYEDPQEQPTLGERLAMTTARSSALHKAFKPGGGHDVPLKLGAAKEQNSRSAAEILDNLEDLEEDEKAQEQRIIALTKDNNDLKRMGSSLLNAVDLTEDSGDDEAMVPSGSGPSHMRDLYRNVPKRPKEY